MMTRGKQRFANVQATPFKLSRSYYQRLIVGSRRSPEGLIIGRRGEIYYSQTHYRGRIHRVRT